MNVFAIEHPTGLCLFDTGQEAAAGRPGYFPAWHPFHRLSRFELDEEDEAGPQLELLGFTAADVRCVVLSHLHTDHAGGLGSFSHAEVLVSPGEWKRARGSGAQIRGYLPQYWPAGVEPQLVEFGGPKIGPFPSSADLFGDGRLLLVPTPGHTSGHMGMLAFDGGPHALFGGDMAASTEDLARQRPEIAEFCRSEGIAYLATHDPAASTLTVGL